MREELTRAKEDSQRALQERQEMKEALDHTVEERQVFQSDVEDLTGAKDTDFARQKIAKKHQLVQTMPEELPPDHGMAKEWEKHDETNGKALVCETGCVQFALITIYMHFVLPLCQL